ncbi:MAG: glycosyltransferase family 2 protein [Pseudoxanthomonas sp.]
MTTATSPQSSRGPSGPAQPLVSVIMPVFNAERTLRKSVESVLRQTLPNLELVLVDDCSRDGSLSMMREYADQDPRVKIVAQAANAGVAEARNAGLRAASGSHVAFLDSDDWWDPRKLELQLAQMQESGALVSYAGYQRVAEDGHLLSCVEPPAEIAYGDMLKSNHIGNLTGVYDRRLGDVPFVRMGHEDYVFWLDRVRRAGHAIRVRHEGPLAYYLVRNGSVSANKLRAARWQWRVYRESEHLTLWQACWYMFHYVRHALSKRGLATI